MQYYPPLADLLLRLGYQDQAEQVLRGGLGFATEGMNATVEGQTKSHKQLFAIHSLLGSIYETKGENVSGAITEYESAKKECGTCSEPGQQIAFFNLGAAYAQANPPRKNEGIQQLQSFLARWLPLCC